MEEHAGELVRALDDMADLTVLTWPDRHVPLRRGRIINRLTGRLRRDAEMMQAEKVDAWLALSAPLTALAPYVDAPVYGYVHGSDALKPWMPYNDALDKADRLLKRLGLPTSVTPAWRRRKVRHGLASARLIFANSRYTADLALEFAAVDPAKVHVVHPGVNADYLRVVREPAEGLQILTIARLQPAARRKNVDGLIEAMALLMDDLPVSLTVIGDGDDLPRLRALAEAKGLDRRVTFTGDATRSEIGLHLARANVLVLAVKPTATDVEGFGMVYVEAACAGVPSIAVATGGVRDAIEDGHTGILLPDPAPQTIADGVRRFAYTRHMFREEHIREFGRERTAAHTTRRLWSLIESDLKHSFDSSRHQTHLAG
ncbi:glycosyltransferase [Sphingomonas corticis]|jgi:glycosyltransferase involved in cell wall biosynthesis|uniref:Glycosyltransferase family 4 protein n=1 Tax=Sphingomonas corticis TaxID=2722791 RepID=A0ABX1CMZ8_9SPHN|nr:glycosyltransferase [Sphingomonas corticis]NJR77710.1 glycosyltransferase family 4 protein [Sphingomonas corticis]